MKKYLEKYALFLHKKFGITPNGLTYIRIFAAPWLALLISEIIRNKNFLLVIITLILYFKIISTDFLDGILARALPKNDHIRGGMLDRLADKILIIFLLIPFGLNLFTFLIISGESILALEALYAPNEKKQAGMPGKIKMILQTFLIPILILQIVANIIPDIFVYFYIILTIIATGYSVYSHFTDYFYFKNE